MDYYGIQDPETDPAGNRPHVCTQSEEAPVAALPDVHVFNVSICKGPARLRLTVRLSVFAEAIPRCRAPWGSFLVLI
jgi:hypothetical protein